MSNKDIINEWKKVIEDLLELKCNHCGAVFKGEHECDYEKLKEMNKELKSLSLWSIRRLHESHKEFGYNQYDKITGEKAERV